MGYVKLAGGTALRSAAINAGNQAGSEVDLAKHHMLHNILFLAGWKGRA
jgi:hypothetical protein